VTEGVPLRLGVMEGVLLKLDVRLADTDCTALDVSEALFDEDNDGEDDGAVVGVAQALTLTLALMLVVAGPLAVLDHECVVVVVPESDPETLGVTDEDGEDERVVEGVAYNVVARGVDDAHALGLVESDGDAVPLLDVDAVDRGVKFSCDASAVAEMLTDADAVEESDAAPQFDAELETLMEPDRVCDGDALGEPEALCEFEMLCEPEPLCEPETLVVAEDEGNVETGATSVGVGDGVPLGVLVGVGEAEGPSPYATMSSAVNDADDDELSAFVAA